MRVIFSGKGYPSKVDSIGAFTVLRNAVLSSSQRWLHRAACVTGLPFGVNTRSFLRLITAQLAVSMAGYQAFRPSLQEILTGDSGSGMPLFIYRQPEVIA